MPRSPLEPVGCAQCWPESAEATWEFRQQLVCDRTLVDEFDFNAVIDNNEVILTERNHHGGVDHSQCR